MRKLLFFICFTAFCCKALGVASDDVRSKTNAVDLKEVVSCAGSKEHYPKRLINKSLYKLGDKVEVYSVVKHLLERDLERKAFAIGDPIVKAKASAYNEMPQRVLVSHYKNASYFQNIASCLAANVGPKETIRRFEKIFPNGSGYEKGFAVLLDGEIMVLVVADYFYV